MGCQPILETYSSFVALHKGQDYEVQLEVSGWKSHLYGERHLQHELPVLWDRSGGMNFHKTLKTPHTLTFLRKI